MTVRLLGALAFVLVSSVHSVPALAQAVGSVPLTPVQEQALGEVQKLVNEAMRIYQRDKLEIRVVSWVGSGEVTEFARAGVVYSSVGFIYLAPRVLSSPHLEALIASTAGYHILRAPSRATSLAEYERERAQRRLDVNAKGVEILVRTKGMSERDALDAVYTWLLAQHRAHRARPESAPKGQIAPCDQIRDLLARFPQHRAWTAGRECAPAG